MRPKKLLSKILVCSILSSSWIFSTASHANATFNFTTAGASGRLGPTQTQVNSVYISTNLAGLVTINTQGIQEWTVPNTGTYSILIAGAKGGGANGGLGSRMYGEFSLTQGNILKILVGQMGSATGGTSAGGGGGSFVWITNQTSNPLIAAGGGGGQSGGSRAGVGATITTSGTAGTTGATSNMAGAGGINGNPGQTYDNTGNSWDAAAGAGWLGNSLNATQYSGGNQNFAYSPLNGGMGGNKFGTAADCMDNSGGFGGGGGGGGSASASTNTNCGGGGLYGVGGGGGGYSGGGNGSNDSSSNRGAGGGGGSYNAGSNQNNTAAVNASDGYVTITQFSTPDTTAPTFTSSSSFSAAENISISTAAATIKVSESATVTISSGADAALFTISNSDTVTALIKFKASPNYEAPSDSGGNNVYDLVLTATDSASNSGTQTITITVTDVVDTSSFNSFSLSATPSYRRVVTITANITVAAKVTFRAKNVIIAGCKNKLATGSGSSFSATCSWKPSTRGNTVLTATAVPISGAISSSTATPLAVNVSNRSGGR